MQLFFKISNLNKNRLNLLLAIFLLLLTAASALFIATAGKLGLLLIAGVIGLTGVLLILAYPIIGFYFCLILSFFIFDIIRFTDTDLPAVAFLDVASYLTFAGVIVNKLVKKEKFWEHCKSPIVYMYLAVLCYFLFQFFNPNGGNPELYLLSSRRFLALLLYLYSAIQLLKDYKTIRGFFITLLVLAVIAGVYACYQQWFGLPRFELEYFYKDPDMQRQILFYMALGSLRKCSFLSDCTAFGLLMSGTGIIALTFALKLDTSLKNKFMLYTGLIILVLAMSFSGTRTATIMLIAEIALYSLMTLTEWKTLLLTCVFALLFAAIMIAPPYGNKTIPRLRSTFDFEDASLNVRNVNRHNIQPYIYSHPFGGGVRTTGVVFAKYNVGHPLAGFPTDSGLLSLVLELGWVGLLLQCITYFIFLQQGIRGYYRSRNPRYKVFLLAATLCLFGYVIAQYSQLAISQIPSGFIFYALIAVIIRLPQIEAAQIQNPNNKT